MMEFLKEMRGASRAGLIAGACVVVLGMAFALWWVLSPDYQLLFGDLRQVDAADITKSLAEWKVPYRITAGGSGIEVPEDQVYETRMKLVSAGVPSGGHVGFELFDDSDFGVTEFAQRVNYQRAVQGELERSIASLPGVQSVRVHLTIRRPGLFVGQDDSSKASVVVGLVPGEKLSSGQVRGIRNLVASAVDGLSPSAVAVLGPSGVLQGGGTLDDGAVADKDEEQSALESRLKARISGLLSSVFKLQSFRVSVDVRLNYDKVHRVTERLIGQGGDGNGLLTRKQSSRSGSAGSNADVKQASSAQDELDYAHGTEREELVKAPGSVERISVAILVPATLSSLDVNHLKTLVGAAAGIDPERGDHLEVTPMAQLETVDIPRKSTSSGHAISGRASDESGKRQAATISAMPSTLWLVLVGLICLLLGWGLSRFTQPPLKRHRPEERDAVLAKMRKWIAEGGELV